MAPIPAARPIGDFSMERIGPDVVLFDLELNRYHTLNGVAFDIWRGCDGQRSVDQLSKLLATQREVVEAAVQQLGEAGLLEAPEHTFESKMHRRKMLKLVAAGAIGAVGVPVVASITRVGPEASATNEQCTGQGDCGAVGGGKCCCWNCNGGHGTCSDAGGCANGTFLFCVGTPPPAECKNPPPGFAPVNNFQSQVQVQTNPVEPKKEPKKPVDTTTEQQPVDTTTEQQPVDTTTEQQPVDTTTEQQAAPADATDSPDSSKGGKKDKD